jgi:hypothetical protein
VETEKAATKAAPSDCVIVQPDRQQLRPGDVPVLPTGNLGDNSVYIRVSSHIVHSLVTAAFPPET